VVHHLGRRTGTAYETPVNVFWLDADAVVALTYGPSADWVQNAAERPASLTIAGTTHPIARAALIERPSARPALPILVRLALRMLNVHHFLRLSLGRDVSSR
jgi:deazaflavin-dependent oxidoreductase (nitroreductase family)